MKLGILLLKGFRGSKNSKKVPTRFVKKRTTSKGTQLPISVGNKKLFKKSDRMAIDHPVTVQKKSHQAVLVPENGMSSSLSSLELIRPDGKLRKSIESFLLDQRSVHTRTAYGKDLNRFIKYLILRKSSRGIDAIDRGLIIGYKDHLLSEKLLHTTIDRHLATLKSFFGWLVEDGIIDRNHAETVRFLNPKRESTTKGFTDDEVVKVLSLPDLYTKTGSLHYAILMVLFYCGLRRSELCELRTSSVGFERGHHYLKLRGKGNSERIVVMTKPVWKAIGHYLRINRKKLDTDQALFSPVKNNRTFLREKALDSSMIFYIVTRYSALAGIKHKVSPHSCRATAISNARDHQVPDRAIQEFAGWASPLMITRYDKRKSALEKSAVHSISYGDQNREIPSESLIASTLNPRIR